MVGHGQHLDPKRRRQERLQLLVHWLTAFVIFTKGITKLDHGVEVAGVLFVAAALVALGAVFHHRLEHRFPYFNAFFFLIEAAVLFLVAWLYQHDGTRYLHIPVYVSAMLYIIATGVFISRKRARSSPRAV